MDATVANILSKFILEKSLKLQERLISRSIFMALKFNPAPRRLRLVMIFLSRVLSPLREVRDEALKKIGIICPWFVYMAGLKSS